MKSNLYRSVFAVSSILSSSLALAGPTYHLNILDGVNNPGQVDSIAYAINSSGQIAGNDINGNYMGGMMWNNGAMVNIGGIKQNGYTYQSFTTAINDSGVVVGSSANSSPYQRAIKYVNGTVTDLGAPGGLMSASKAINNKGDIAGIYSYQTGFGYQSVRGVVWHANGSMTVLNSGGPSGSAAGVSGINNSGLVVGSYQTYNGDVAAEWKNGSSTATLIPGLSTVFHSQANAVNDQGDIIGAYFDDNYQSKGNFALLGGKLTTLTALGGVTALHAISNTGVILGTALNPSGTVRDDFIWSATTGYTYLKKSLDKPFTGTWLSAYGLNSDGDIVGTAIIDGNYHAIELTPVVTPEPSVVFALTSGLGLVALRRRKK